MRGNRFVFFAVIAAIAGISMGATLSLRSRPEVAESPSRPTTLETPRAPFSGDGVRRYSSRSQNEQPLHPVVRTGGTYSDDENVVLAAVPSRLPGQQNLVPVAQVPPLQRVPGFAVGQLAPPKITAIGELDPDQSTYV